MTRQLIIGFMTEGSTDERFLAHIIQHSFEDAAFLCDGFVEILPVQYIDKPGGDFIESVKSCAKSADGKGVMIFCVHVDADDTTDHHVMQYKIQPAFEAVAAMIEADICKNLVAIIPVQMVEAWMLANKDLLKAEIGTTKNDLELGIEKSPEDYADPKEAIENTIRIARQMITKRRRRELTISDLYASVGQKIILNQLEGLPSYRKFKEQIKNALIKLNYLNG